MIQLQVAFLFLLCLSISSKTTFYGDCIFLLQSGGNPINATHGAPRASSESGPWEGKTSGRPALGSSVAEPWPHPGHQRSHLRWQPRRLVRIREDLGSQRICQLPEEAFHTSWAWPHPAPLLIVFRCLQWVCTFWSQWRPQMLPKWWVSSLMEVWKKSLVGLWLLQISFYQQMTPTITSPSLPHSLPVPHCPRNAT